MDDPGQVDIIDQDDAEDGDTAFQETGSAGDDKFKIVIAIILFAGLLIWIFPFYWMIITGLKEQAEVFQFPPTFIPRTANLSAFRAAFESLEFSISFTNSVIISAGAALLQCVVCALAAYPLARMKFKGREFMFLFFISTMMIPLNTIITGNFEVLNQLGWIDTYQALIIPFGASGLAIFIFRQFFRTIPQDLEDAARIDGCGRLRFIIKILFPIAKPAFASVGIFVWQSQWNQFLWPLIMTNSREMWVIQVALSAMDDAWGTNHPEMMAAAAITALPPLILFIFLQKYFIQGIARTGID